MADPTNQDLKDMILSLEKLILNLDKKIDLGLTELNRKIDVGLAEVRVEIAEVRGEVKRLEEKVDGLGKRLDNQEFINRGAILTLVGAVTTGLVKYLFFPDRPI
ncbi:MAG: hypothetical protein OHK0012_24850 [Synechococcales cyanobacterium]